MIIFLGNFSSSSIFDDKSQHWGPQYAADGKWSKNNEGIFSSKTERMPWLQWQLPEKENVVGITISTPSVEGELLRNVEIRAGTTKLEAGYRGKISTNTFCGKFSGPGGNRRAYTILCESKILADFISIQMLEENSQLQINELELVTSSTGKTQILTLNLMGL